MADAEQAAGSRGEGSTATGSLSLPFGFHSPEELDRMIQDSVAALAEVDININMFTYKAVVRMGFTSHQFVKLVRVLTVHVDLEMKTALMELGTRMNFFDTPRGCDLQSFINFCKFLKTKEGHEAVERVRLNLKLRKSTVFEGRIDVACLVEAFNMQCQRLAVAMKKTKEKFDAEEMELRKGLGQINAKRVDRLREIRAQYQPASLYVEMTEVEVRRACYELYLDEARALNKVPLPIGEEGYSMAKKMFQGLVRKKNVAAFVDVPANRAMLVRFIKDSILHYEDEYMMKQAGTYRYYLELLGEMQPAPFVQGALPVRGGAGACLKAPPAEESAIVLLSGSGEAGREEADRGEGVAAFAERTGKRHRGDRSPGKEPQEPRSEVAERGGARCHAHCSQ